MLLLCAWAACPSALDAQITREGRRLPDARPEGVEPERSSAAIDAHGPRGVPLMLLVAPFAGMPVLDGRMQPALGAHVEWQVADRLGIAARYEWRSLGDSRYSCTSLDAVWRLAGTDTVALALTGGWARWQGQDRADVGLRFRGAMATTASGGAVIEFWADVRYAFGSLHNLMRLNGRPWVSAMLVVPVNFSFRR